MSCKTCALATPLLFKPYNNLTVHINTGRTFFHLDKGGTNIKECCRLDAPFPFSSHHILTLCSTSCSIRVKMQEMNSLSNRRVGPTPGHGDGCIQLQLRAADVEDAGGTLRQNYHTCCSEFLAWQKRACLAQLCFWPGWPTHLPLTKHLWYLTICKSHDFPV